MARLLLATLGLFTGYHALLVLTPLYLAHSGASDIAIGATTAAFMLFAVAGHLAAPGIVVRLGTRRPFAIVILGTALAASLQALTAAVPAILLLSAFRGAVYGIGAVVSATAVAFLAAVPQRAMALARYGSAAALPGLLASTLAVYIAEARGFPTAFLCVAAVTFVAVVALSAEPSGTLMEGEGVRGPLPPALVWAAILFAAFAMVYGAALTFVPAQLTAQGSNAYPFVLSTALGLTAGRWGGGATVAMIGPARTFAAGLVLGSCAMLLLALLPPDLAPIGGLLFGSGFGLGGTATHSILTTRTHRANLGKANAVFNVSWSGGMGIGAFAFGILATASSVVASYLVSAGWHVLVGVGLVAWHVTTSRRPPSGTWESA